MSAQLPPNDPSPQGEDETLGGTFLGVVWSNARDEELYSTGEVWNAQ